MAIEGRVEARGPDLDIAQHRVASGQDDRVIDDRAARQLNGGLVEIVLSGVGQQLLDRLVDSVEFFDAAFEHVRVLLLAQASGHQR